MRNLSFALTTPRIRDRSKTVTRRDGWTFLKPGVLVQAVEKGQGLKRGEHVKKLAVLRIASVRREPLDWITVQDVEREGFPGMTPDAFVRMFCETHRGVGPQDMVTRIEFSYVKNE